MKPLIRAFLPAGLLVLMLARAAAASPGDVYPFPIQETCLENGLRVIAVPYDSPGVVAFLTVVRTGARDELEPGCSGFAHFFEHMMFKGTKRFPGPARDRALMLIGAESNAFTSDDFTCYHVVGSARSLERIMEVEADRFLHLSYSEEDLKTEAKVILGEYQKSSSSPYSVLEERLRDLAFTTHTYKHTVIGFPEDIRNMPNQYAYSRLFHARGYRPESCIVLVAGDVDPARLERLARKYYGSWKAPARVSGEGPRERAPSGPRGDIPPGVGVGAAPPVEPPQMEARAAHIPWPNETLPMVYLGFHVPAFSDRNPDGAALEVLANLAFSSISPLYRKLVLEERLVESLSADAGQHRDPYLFTIMARVKEDKDLDYVRQAILDTLQEAGRAPFEKDQLEAVKSNCRYGFAMGLDTPQGAAFALAGFLSCSPDPGALNRYYRTLQRVTPLDVLRVGRRYFSPANRTLVTLTHVATGPASVSEVPPERAPSGRRSPSMGGVSR